MQGAAMAAFLRRGVAAVLLAAALISSVLTGSEGADPNQLVTTLPGAPTGLNFTQYAGRVTVNETTGRALFYWFITADHPNASSKPLAIWLNGGPGCSSVGNGLLGELGPFFPAGEVNNTYLVLNPDTWIKEANIIFLESPVAVGFSYSNTSSDYDLFTDSRTAQDNLQFLLSWFDKFPEYKTNDFYLLGESYAGHYIPTFAREIVRYNDAQGPNKFQIKFKGFAVGNPWTDAYYNNLGATDWWHSHDLISDEVYEGLLHNCDFAKDRAVDYGDTNPWCVNASDATDIDLYFLDSYDIYAAYCNTGNTARSASRSTKKVNAVRDQVIVLSYAGGLLTCSAFTKSIGFLKADATSNPCSPDLVTPWLNLPIVQEALHVEPYVQWASCSDTAFENYSLPDLIESMLPIYTELIARGLRLWIYNGDVDSVCPTTASRYAIKSLNLKIKIPWYPWQHDTQVGGFTEVYNGLTFATVRDAGHLVPFYQPGRALTLFKSFLANRSLPQFSI